MAEPARPFRAVFADDEPLARDLVRTLLARDPEIEVVAECANGSQALEAVRIHEPDLLLLDVQMPGMDGFAVVEALDPADMPLVVFATAHDQHALRAFEVHAVDYLLKPFDAERFERAIGRAKERLRARVVADAGQRMAELLVSLGRAPAARGEWLRRLAVPHGNRVDYVDTADIDWIEAADQYVKIHVGTKEHLMRGSLASLEGRLDPAAFSRVHRSAIVALDRVRTLESLGDGSARVRIGEHTWIPVGRARLAELKERLG